MSFMSNIGAILREAGIVKWDRFCKALDIIDQIDRSFLGDIPTVRLAGEILRRGGAKFYYHGTNKRGGEILIRITRGAYCLPNARRPSLLVPQKWRKELRVAEGKYAKEFKGVTPP